MNKFLVVFFLWLLTCTKLHAGIKDSVGVNKVNDKLHILYLVEPGETIYGISTKYGIPVSDLLEINPELENGLKVGQIIQIPYRPELKAKTADENAIVHKVQSGETLYSIARKYNTSVNELMRMNNMQLKAGMDLVVGYKDKPKDHSQTPSTPPSRIENPAKMPADSVVKDAPKEIKVPDPNLYPFDPERKQVLVIPFDPYLYFSDCDAEIAAKSNMAMPKVRQVFRRRLNALLTTSGYEMIHLLGGKTKDSTSDLNKIYSSVTYGYQDVLYNPENPRNAEFMAAEQAQRASQGNKTSMKDWLEKQKDKLQNGANATKYETPEDHGEYFGVRVKDPSFWTYFQNKYSVDYYIFINQFEVKTNYENCLDRAALNYERTFTTHYSIFDANGKQIAGNKFKTRYNSNSNHVFTIVGENMPKVVDRILSDLPPPTKN
ncbi:MAG: LysM peptidoglycan-binding domain-containing protein [Cytophagaceae bacterium]|nr:LysM peptidoglycan-binding domain-containing protein [Cytophagaceae bacterium]